MRLSRLTPFLLAVYASIHVWWGIVGPPQFDSFGESFIPGLWTPVAIAAAALIASLLLLRQNRRSRAVVALGWAIGISMILYSFMFALDLVSMLFGEFTVSDWPGFLIRGLGIACGLLTVRETVSVQRRARGACPRCGRVSTAHPGSPRTDPAPWWAYVAAYSALAGAAARLGAELVVGLPWAPTDPTGIVFLTLYAAAGALLPLALAHRWGRVWPRWVLPLAGRDVPRWIVLIPAFAVGGGLTAYFGLVGGTYIVLGRFDTEFPRWWAMAVIPGYTVWGIGLLVAGVFYLSATQPSCSEMSGDAAAARGEPRPPVRRNAVLMWSLHPRPLGARRWLLSAGFISVLPYISMKTYWALGGRVGLPNGFDMAREFEKNGAPELLVWMERHGIDFTVVMALSGVGLLAMLAGTRSLPVPRVLLLIPASMGAIFFVPYGLLTAVLAASGGTGAQGQLTGWLTVAAVLTFCGLGTCLGICAVPECRAIASEHRSRRRQALSADPT